MARIYPQFIPDTVRQDPGRWAECVVYDALNEQLADDWLVLYNNEDEDIF